MNQWRITALKVFLFLLLGAITARLFYWQVLTADQLQAQAEGQQVSTAKSLGQRGNIYFRDGSLLASSQLSYVVFADKKSLKEPDIVSKTLAPLLSVDEASISAKLQQSLLWIPLERNVSAETKKAIEVEKLAGIGFDRNELRFYPEASMAASLLGFVGKDNVGKNRGYFGLEGFYNIELQGKEGYVRQEKDVFGRPILTAKAYESLPRRGHNLLLNLDRTIQYIAEQKLKEGIKKFEAKSGDVTIMDPKTGGILALAVYPGYSPAEYFKAEQSAYTNPVVGETYEPGSTFKSIIMSAAINEGAVKPDTRCPCGAPTSVGGYTIHNWDNTYRKDEIMGDILKNSDNNGMIFVGERLGKERLPQYLNKFGIGAATNIDLEDEQVPQLRKKSQWYSIDYATATFGQGIAVTPIQLLRAFGALANGGKMMEPHVVYKIIADDKEIEIKPKIVREVISEKAAETMKQLLTYAVDNGEAGRLYKPKGFSIAAKSGTAQVPIAGHYDSAKIISSYIGFGPTENPRYVMLVRLRDPQGGGTHGATTAGPIFYDISKELFTYWGITPSQ